MEERRGKSKSLPHASPNSGGSATKFGHFPARLSSRANARKIWRLFAYVCSSWSRSHSPSKFSLFLVVQHCIVVVRLSAEREAVNSKEDRCAVNFPRVAEEKREAANAWKLGSELLRRLKVWARLTVFDYGS